MSEKSENVRKCQKMSENVRKSFLKILKILNSNINKWTANTNTINT